MSEGKEFGEMQKGQFIYDLMDPGKKKTIHLL